MNAVALTGLVKITLPARTLLYCDGGFFVYNTETYREKDDVYGTIGRVETLSEGVGDSVPAMVMTLLPPSTSAVASISIPGNQTSSVTFTIAEFDIETGVISTGEEVFVGQLDQTVFTLGRDRRELTMSIVSLAERLFEGNIGNSLNSTFHKSVWAGETGEDNATGIGKPIAWGVEKPPSVTTSYSGGFAGFNKNTRVY